MEIDITTDLAIRPAQVKPSGTVELTFIAKSTRGSDPADVVYSIDRGNDVWFEENGIQKKELGPSPQNFTTTDTVVYRKVTLSKGAGIRTRVIMITAIVTNRQGESKRTSNAVITT